MPGQAGYNSVETLLLFQHLWSYGVNTQVFGRVSEQLVNDADVRSQPDFDPNRLTPDALRELFIRIVHDESRAPSNGASASSPRKRKAPSPTLPTLQDVAKNLDLLPKLILKLYSRVREHIVSDMRETENKYAKAKQDIAAIQRGDWDAKIQDGLAEGEKLKTTVNGSRGKVHLEPGHLPNHYIQRTPSPTSTTIELPRTVPRPQVVINQAASRPSYSQPPYRPIAGQPQPPYAQSPTVTSKSPSLPPSRQTTSQSPRLPAPQTARTVSRGGIMLQPFQVSPQVPNSVSRQLEGVQSRILGQYGTPVTPPVVPKSNPLILTVAKSLEDPDLFKKNPPSAWKSDLAFNQPATPSPIQIRGISPIVEPPPSPETSTRTRAKAKQEKLSTTARSSRASRRIRGASAASSVVDSSVRGRTRSQSIVSQASADDAASKSVIEAPQGSDMLGDETPMPAPPRRGFSTRSKRKRSVPASEASAPDLTQGDPEPEPDVDPEKMVLAVRNFPRVSNVVFAEINSHKHAGLFSNPVRERDAEGYSSMIRRPTDLKTVKAAIQAGARAINNDESANAAISASGTATSSRDATALLLPWSEDLVPPKGIVNSAQLEKELMRMFANAVMFNPGNEDVVEDATEMFDQTVVQLMQFREAEKGAEQGPIARKSEAIEEEEESTPAQSTSKRRKVV